MPRARKLSIALVLVAFLALVSSASALDVTADSCSRDHIQAAVDQVIAAGGGTVYIPAGDPCTWTNGEQVNVSDLSGSISIIGAGKDNTILRLYPDSATDLHFNVNNVDFIRISGIGLYATNREPNGAGTANSIKLIWVDNYRIDNCHIEGAYNGAITWKNTPKGLIDHCTFKRPPDDYGGSTYGLSPGSSYTPYDSMPQICN